VGQATSSSPSSSASPPSLLQSSFSSAPDSHSVEPPSTPYTPPRGRSRYPSSLAPDGPRVPLHRRGTSNTYERLEDLLKEAGYKETRVFTPESERLREHEWGRGEGRQNNGKLKNRVDAMVGFLAGLVSGQTDGQPAGSEASRTDRVEQATLDSPLTRKSEVTSDASTFRVTFIGRVDVLRITPLRFNCESIDITNPRSPGRPTHIQWPSRQHASTQHLRISSTGLPASHSLCPQHSAAETSRKTCVHNDGEEEHP